MWANNGIYENNEQTNERGNERMANNVTETTDRTNRFENPKNMFDYRKLLICQHCKWIRRAGRQAKSKLIPKLGQFCWLFWNTHLV